MKKVRDGVVAAVSAAKFLGCLRLSRVALRLGHRSFPCARLLLRFKNSVATLTPSLLPSQLYLLSRKSLFLDSLSASLRSSSSCVVAFAISRQLAVLPT